MPRKGHQKLYYEDEYDDYYEDDHEYAENDYADMKDDDATSSSPQENIAGETVYNESKVWHCPICTYDNPEGYLACDICGVVRQQNVEVDQALPTARDELRAMKASNLGRSLFAELPPENQKVQRVAQQVKESFFHDQGHPEGNGLAKDFMELTLQSSDFSSKQGYSKLVPFKFDSPSPDDKVLSGKAGNAKCIPAEASLLSNVPNDIPSTKESKGGVGGNYAGTLKFIPAAYTRPVGKKTMRYNKDKRIENGHISSLSQDEGDSQVGNGLKHISLDEKLQENDVAKHETEQYSSRGLPLESYRPESWMLDDDGSKKKLLHLVIVGHVDAGKSTLMGRMLHLLGVISQKEMHKHQKGANQIGKGSFAYAWALDEGSEERARGVTMTVAMKHFETKKFKVVLLDAPGHKDFIPNMISGAAQADAAVLVVDAATGAFEAGFEGQGQVGGQTREHAQLVRSLGVSQLVVAINKLDAVNYSSSRFSQIKDSLAPFLKQCGFKESAIIWVPVSGIEAQNLVTSPSDTRLTSWYRGMNLLEAIDILDSPARLSSKPLRLVVAEVISSITLGPNAVSGKLESGALKVGSKVLLMPSRELAKVKTLEQDGQSMKVGRSGDNLDVGLQGVNANALMVGGVLCHPDYPVPVATQLELKVLTLGITIPLLQGTQVVLHAHHVKEPARISDLVSLLDLKTGAIKRQSPRCITANQSALIQVVPERGICVEEYANFRSLGRIILRDGGKTLAVGIISRVISQQ